MLRAMSPIVIPSSVKNILSAIIATMQKTTSLDKNIKKLYMFKFSDMVNYFK